MRCAREEGLHNNREIERKKFKSIKEKVENIYLTESEVKKIQDIDFARLTPERIVIMQESGITNINHLDIARDVFLAGVYTAQRFSDFSKIKPENILNRQGGLKVISLIQQKTGERVIIPIRPELDLILNKYGYRLPKVFEQKINKAIKVVGSILDINEPTLIEETKGGFKVKKTVPKYELIKTHTARRTGCTLMYLAGVPTLDIMKISGHKTEREFLNYIKVGKEETAVNLSKHPYFMGNHLKIAK
jgi:integrase